MGSNIEVGIARLLEEKWELTCMESVFQLGFEKYVSYPCACLLDKLITDKTSSGGPAGLIYGFLIVWAGTAAVFASLSELSSMHVFGPSHFTLSKYLQGTHCRRPIPLGLYACASLFT